MGNEIASINLLDYLIKNKIFCRAIRNTLKKPVEFPPAYFDNVSQDSKNFIEALLRKDQCERMSAAESLSHDWLRVDEVDGGSTRSTVNYTMDTLRMRRYRVFQ